LRDDLFRGVGLAFRYGVGIDLLIWGSVCHASIDERARSERGVLDFYGVLTIPQTALKTCPHSQGFPWSKRTNVAVTRLDSEVVNHLTWPMILMS
jgi:hypothetical protein